MFEFDILHTSQKSRARTGLIKTNHGTIETPAFIFCATKANIKNATIAQIKACDTQIILCNTYHLMLQPGTNIIAKTGGIHKFMGWDGPILTDSGGFQIFSMGHCSVSDEIKKRKSNNFKPTLLKINSKEAVFRSYTDGTIHHLSPEKSIHLQQQIGADIILTLDECTPFHVSKEYTAKSMHMSHEWALRCLNSFSNHKNQALYGIIQGGVYKDLRTESINFNNNQPFSGHAIGGSLGQHKDQMYDIVDFTTQKLNRTKPIHLLGIGDFCDIKTLVKNGIDTFDCVHPVRIARHGCALFNDKYINLYNSKYKNDPDPINKDCLCYTCQHHSCAYIHHLLKAKEFLSNTLLTIHNIYQINSLMTTIRIGINNNMI